MGHLEGQALLLSQSPTWIDKLASWAQSGWPHAAIALTAAVWAAASRLAQPAAQPRPRTLLIVWKYELPIQLTRIAPIALLAVSHAYRDVAILAYGLTLGLARHASSPTRRRSTLRQVNFVYTAVFCLHLAARYLSCLRQGTHCHHSPVVTAATVFLALHVALLVVTPQRLSGSPSPEEECSLLGSCTYAWLDPVIWKGVTKRLDMSGMPALPWYNDPQLLFRRLQSARSVSRNTFRTILRFQGRHIMLMAAWCMAAQCFDNVAPFSMFKLLEYLAEPDAAVYRPGVWLALVFLGPVARSLCHQQYIFNSTRLVVRVKSAMTQELYSVALSSMQADTSSGRLLTLMAADIDGFLRARSAVMALAGISTGTLIAFFGMYRMFGWPSLVGMAILLLAIPVSVWLGRHIFKRQRLARKAQDSRISLIAEYLSSIRVVKYFAWEEYVSAQVGARRADEQKDLWRVSVLQALANQITQIFPFLALLIMFGLHVGLQKKPLTASIAFTTLYLVRNLRRNILQASQVARNVAGALVSLERLDEYFDTAVLKPKLPQGPLRMQNATVRRHELDPGLKDVSIDFVEGGLNVISGNSGSGKTTLLLSILGEIQLMEGSINAPEDIAYAPQTSWLQNLSIKANIVFGVESDQLWYNRIVDACRLRTDLAGLPEGEDTHVGENGASLSGGQKARVALARALYSRAPLLLLDDIFSALDAKTAAGIWEDCFCSRLLQGKTVVLVTQLPWIASQADLNIILDGGKIQKTEAHLGVVRRPIHAQVAEQVVQRERKDVDGPNIAARETQSALVDQETKASGHMGRLTFLHYMRYFGHPLFTVVCLACLAGCGLLTFVSAYWLSIWVEAYQHQGHVNAAYYLGIYAALTVSEIALFASLIILFEWGGWRAARMLHSEFIAAVTRVSLSWYRAIPVGRVTNRFAGDMASIDNSLSSVLRLSLESLSQLFFRLAAVSSIMPIFMLPALCTSLCGIVVAEMYTRTAVIVKRLTSSSQSPVFSQFADTLAGMSVIRARAGMARSFQEALAQKMSIYSRAFETSLDCNRWVAVRVDFITSLVVLLAGIIAISKAGVIGAGLVGFSLSNANDLSTTILVLVRSLNDLEVEMQSFHRVREYVKLAPEDQNDKPYPEEGLYSDGPCIPRDWPSSGEVEFRNVTVRYREDGPDILKDVNLKFRPGERVAIVGRTGSGKSTLVLSLLRFTHVVSGQILYDGLDITKVPRQRLRKALTVIPQEAVLFTGTVGSNMDPSGQTSPDALQRVLDYCHSVASFDDAEAESAIQLDTVVQAGGENFSHGQRQVLSLCRAILRHNRLMLFDEATANMDYVTDEGIQQILRAELDKEGERTLVTVAHRLRTVIDYDQVVVMGAGRVVEVGSPRELLAAKGPFHEMIQHSGEGHVLEDA
ncbi:P-loop containing nucleoside triphosphate hydrolase protein [Emericellopsis atlantica]|uniref:P-loop containing nucleoside triphosphate hydrolase protein n=1 Tax=Emericellopsis atlantica TaxID=2614577 RepID=A0A9P7ZKA8_9HYPO|nr:P-loop containing nucleoside triphosphate hydrolase protein [Emericellopsis atlantica]KAG9253175.1 P-loop containing nucleoside triphosphate hydrolase protein [Emericellopsis atlantica]